MDKPEHHIFVCTSARLTGQNQGYCIQKDSASIIANFNEEIADRDLENQVMVTTTGCLGICTKGPVVMIYPQQTWYGKVTPDDVAEIMDALEGGAVVERLVI